MQWLGYGLDDRGIVVPFSAGKVIFCECRLRLWGPSNLSVNWYGAYSGKGRAADN